MIGKFISFEGVDGSGKSTQVEKLYQWYLGNGHRVIKLREPGGTKLGEALRNILKFDDAGKGIHRISELLLFQAARAEIVNKVIIPNLHDGVNVICDRFIDSTTAYQGYGRGIDIHTIMELNRVSTENLVPDVTFFINPHFSLIQKRVSVRAEEKDSIELAGLEFQQKVLNGYADLSCRNDKRIVEIKNGGSPDEVFEDVIKEVYTRFYKKEIDIV